MTVWDLCVDLVRHPVQRLIRNWHWKSAALGACIRGSIFFAANAPHGIDVAIRAMLVDSVFRVPVVGALGSITQALLRAEPRWRASLAATVVLPGLAHVIEFVVHWNAGTPELGMSVMASLVFSAISTLFNLFAMRRGVLIVGGAGHPFREDVKRLPGVISDFLLVVPRAALTARAVRRQSCRSH